jgi:PAS domain S-box-containing protein
MKTKSFEKKVSAFELSISKIINASTAQLSSEKEHLFHEILLSLPMAVSINRLSNGHFVYVNHHFLKLTKLKKNQIIGKKPSELPLTFNCRKQKNALDKLSKENHVKEVSIDLTNAKGLQLTVVADANKILFESETLVFTTFRDMTEPIENKKDLVASEKKFKLIFEKSLAPSIIADDLGNYLDANKAVAKLFGYSIKDLKKMNVMDIITESRSKSKMLYEDYIKKGKDVGEFDFVDKNGNHKTVVLTCPF